MWWPQILAVIRWELDSAVEEHSHSSSTSICSLWCTGDALHPFKMTSNRLLVCRFLTRLSERLRVGVTVWLPSAVQYYLAFYRENQNRKVHDWCTLLFTNERRITLNTSDSISRLLHACHIQEEQDYLSNLIGLLVPSHSTSSDKDTRRTQTIKDSLRKEKKIGGKGQKKKKLECCLAFASLLHL